MGQTERLKLSNDNKNEEDDEYECQICNANLYVSLLADMEEETTYCLTHGIEHLTGHKELLKNCKLMYTHTRDELKEIIRKLQDRLDEEEYAEEPKDDNSPPNDDEVDDAIEEEDDVEDDDLKPRERSLPSYIKKPKPIISSESEEVVDELKDQETFEALISEDDEVVRPPSKRKQPKILQPKIQTKIKPKGEGLNSQNCKTKDKKGC